MSRERPPDHEIPADSLPEGFARSIEAPDGPPPEARPAATVVLMRPSAGGALEVLLLRRARTSRFVPGAWVFPGGRVDRADRAPGLLERLAPSERSRLARRLGLEGDEARAVGFLAAALRETFEETGLLPGVDPSASARLEELRAGLLRGDLDLSAVLEATGTELGLDGIAYIAHWVTPEAEPRRYDTRFFALRTDPARAVRVIESEITEARWLAPGHALALHRARELPMIFPTIRTLESLEPFDDPDAVLAHFRDLPIPRILPRLVRTPTGVGIVVPEEPPS